jgi:hypothetical protein
VHPSSFGIYMCVPSADVACATKYSSGYPAVLGSNYHSCVCVVIVDTHTSC